MMKYSREHSEPAPPQNYKVLCVVTTQVTGAVLLSQHSVASMQAGSKLCPASGWYQGYIAPSSEADSIASVSELCALVYMV